MVAASQEAGDGIVYTFDEMRSDSKAKGDISIRRHWEDVEVNGQGRNGLETARTVLEMLHSKTNRNS